MRTFDLAIGAGPRRSTDLTDWRVRHNVAAALPILPLKEAALVLMFRGWYDYASQHRLQYESLIGEDYVLGPEWEAIGDSLRALLNGDIGRLDGGTCDSFILGRTQLAWLKRELANSDATWKVIAADLPIGLISRDAIALGDGPPQRREHEIADLLTFIKA